MPGRATARLEQGDLRGALADYQEAIARLPEGDPRIALLRAQITDIRAKLGE